MLGPREGSADQPLPRGVRRFGIWLSWFFRDFAREEKGSLVFWLPLASSVRPVDVAIRTAADSTRSVAKTQFAAALVVTALGPELSAVENSWHRAGHPAPVVNWFELKK